MELLQSAMIITDCLSTVYSDTLQLKEEVDYISKYPEIDKATFRMHASSHRENVASVDRRFISKKELHADLPLVMTNYVRRRRALNEEFVSFSCELPYYMLFPVGWFRHNLR